MRNAQLMTCGKSLVSVTKDGLNRHQDKSESNSTNLMKRPSFLFQKFSVLFVFFACFEGIVIAVLKVSLLHSEHRLPQQSLIALNEAVVSGKRRESLSH